MKNFDIEKNMSPLSINAQIPKYKAMNLEDLTILIVFAIKCVHFLLALVSVMWF